MVDLSDAQKAMVIVGAVLEGLSVPVAGCVFCVKHTTAECLNRRIFDLLWWFTIGLGIATPVLAGLMFGGVLGAETWDKFAPSMGIVRSICAEVSPFVVDLARTADSLQRLLLAGLIDFSWKQKVLASVSLVCLGFTIAGPFHSTPWTEIGCSIHRLTMVVSWAIFATPQKAAGSFRRNAWINVAGYVLLFLMVFLALPVNALLDARLDARFNARLVSLILPIYVAIG
jgi:hypothetical protein